MFRPIKLLITFLVLLFFNPLFAGVGDVYYCVPEGEFVKIYHNAPMKKTFVEKIDQGHRFSFKWEEKGIRGATTYKLDKNGEEIYDLAPFEYVSPSREEFVTKAKDGDKGLSLYTRVHFYQGRLTKVSSSWRNAYLSFYKCDKF